VEVEPDRQPCGEDTTPPETDVELNGADPVASYDGPVDVTLSATDPGGGGGEPVTHQVDAQPATWSPDEVELALGDEIQWNFPASANFNHDVWLIAPDEEPDSAGTEVTDGPVAAGGDPVSATFSEAGGWTFVCKIHSFVSEGAWTGMVGAANVAAGGGDASGVDYTEYRIDSDDPGDWVQSDNDGGDDPFLTEFTVSGEGAHEVDFRSTDNAGNVEAIDSVGFEIEPEVGGTPELGLSVKPKRKTVKPGKRAKFTATATNTGDAEATQVRVCAKAPKAKAKVVGKACATTAALAADASFARKFTLKPKRKARGKRVKVVFTATADGLDTIRRTATLKVKR
jgi:plastocyanin